MKNLLIYISPNKKFNEEHRRMAEVQIKNSLDYWKPEDIVLACNFPYEYEGIKSIEVPDLINSQYPENPRGIINSKINVIIYLLENKIINELAWYHDFDAFQLAPLDLPPIKRLGLVCYGVYPQNRLQPIGDYPTRINFGNVFFTPESLDTFKTLLERMDKNKHYEEDEMTIMYGNGEVDAQILNQTYNIGIRCIKDNVALAEKPIKVVHFPPQEEKWFNKMKPLLPEKLKNMLENRFGGKHILITGCGFIGSYLLNYLRERGFSVISTKEEIRIKHKIKPFLAEAGIVIHTAARTRDRGRNDYYDINVEGTRNVAELCLENGCKMIHFSTIATTEDYGKSKQQAQAVVEELVKKGLKAITLRLCEISVEPKKNCYLLKDLSRDIENIIDGSFKYEVKEFTPLS